jgi:flagellin-specific chaperone FliS
MGRQENKSFIRTKDGDKNMDEYLGKYLNAIQSVLKIQLTEKQKKEIADILDKIYEDGFYDGQNE